MARTRSPNFETIQDSILDRTAALFSSRGYAATSIGEIATACDCSKSRLYHYFESKEAILAEMSSQHVDMVLAETRRAVEAKREPMDRFEAFVRSFLDISLVSREKHIVLLTCLDFLPDLKRRELLKKEREIIALFCDLITDLRPELKNKINVQSVNTMLFFGMISWTYTWYNPSGVIPVSRLADQIIDLFLHGYMGQKVN